MTQLGQPTDEDPLEHLRVPITVRLARFPEGPIRVDQGGDGGTGDAMRSDQVARLTGGPAQLHQSADHHTLVVGPGDAAIVDARAVEAVIHETVSIDHPRCLDPSPHPRGPTSKVPPGAMTGGEPMQTCRGEQKQPVGDRVLVAVPGAPPQPAAAGTVPGPAHLHKQRPGLVKVLRFPRCRVPAQPGVEIPAVVVIEAGAPGPVPGERPLEDIAQHPIARAAVPAGHDLDGQRRLPRLPRRCRPLPATRGEEGEQPPEHHTFALRRQPRRIEVPTAGTHTGQCGTAVSAGLATGRTLDRAPVPARARPARSSTPSTAVARYPGG